MYVVAIAFIALLSHDATMVFCADDATAASTPVFTGDAEQTSAAPTTAVSREPTASIVSTVWATPYVVSEWKCSAIGLPTPTEQECLAFSYVDKRGIAANPCGLYWDTDEDACKISIQAKRISGTAFLEAPEPTGGFVCPNKVWADILAQSPIPKSLESWDQLPRSAGSQMDVVSAPAPEAVSAPAPGAETTQAVPPKSTKKKAKKVDSNKAKKSLCC